LAVSQVQCNLPYRNSQISGGQVDDPKLTCSGTVNFPETGIYFSGGGFSDYFSRPSYQASTVDAYIETLGTTYSTLFNKTGRAYPDIAAYASSFTIYVRGRTSLIGGTSAATPAAAGVFTLLNDALIAAGRPPMGFLNPWLYKNGGVFTDVSSGNAPGCGTDGFEAIKGWDPVTGFGTPRFKALLKALGL